MKRMNLRSSFAFTLLLALVIPILAACGGGTPAAAPTAAPAAEATAAPAGEATAAPAAAATAAPAAEATAAPAANFEPGILRRAIGAEPENMDPQQASFVDEIGVIMLNYQALMTFDLDMKPIPAAAESVDVSADGKTYTFKIRPDSTYSNGDPLTAQNFEFAWKRLADPELNGQYQSIACGIIVGFDDYAAPTCKGATLTETIELGLDTLREGVGVKALDDQTLEIQLVNPAPFFLSMAALWIGAPVREEDAANVDALATAVPENYIGNGPFVLMEHEPDARFVWEANPNYNGPLGPVKLKGIETSVIKDSAVAFQAYKNGELDYIGLAAEDLAAAQSDPELSQQIVDAPGSCTFYLGFNTNKPPFDNVKVRQAFAQAFDREAWVRDVLQGLGVVNQSFIPPGFPGHDPNETQWSFNPDAAKATLAEAGFADPATLPEIKLTFSSSARNKVRFEWVANQLNENLGVNAVLDPVDPTAYTGLLKDSATTPQMYFLGWCADYPDPQNWLTTVFKTGGVSGGRTGWSNAEFDELTAAADIEPDPAKRAELYQQAQTLLVQEASVAFLYSDAGKFLVKPYVQGVEQTPLDYFPGYFNMKNFSVGE